MAATANAAARRRWLTLLLLPLPLLIATATATPSSTSTASITTDRRRCAHKGIAELIRNSPVIVKALAAHIFTDAELAAAAKSTATSEPAAILITLTPETIYKGASLLKMANGAASASIDTGASLGNSAAGVGNSNSGWVGNAAAESSFQYEG